MQVSSRKSELPILSTKTRLIQKVYDSTQVYSGWINCLWAIACHCKVSKAKAIDITDVCKYIYALEAKEMNPLKVHSLSPIKIELSLLPGFPGGSDSKESACQAGALGSIPMLGRSPGEGNGKPLQSSCLENSMDRDAWWATVHAASKSRT